ncbi:PP2C family protein-serine/threonine phosphatase [Streptomyces physcomitrii]|uniref:PP2C family protein-serine/threonine phosphatase n=1 Tax=Streptomyces TaxID=1883 RepID=UPI0006984C87
MQASSSGSQDVDRAPSGPAQAWRNAPCPVVVATGGGDLADLNGAAELLLAGARPGTALTDTGLHWLAEAHRAPGPVPRSGPVGGRVGERSFAAYATGGDGGETVWWLLDDTEERAARTALRDERERSDFLASASDELLASLNVDRSMETIARLSARHLADAAVVVAPASGRWLPVTYADSSGEVTFRRLGAQAEDVPGLREALQGFPPVPSRWIDPGALPDWAVPEGFAGPVGSVVVTPLPGHGVPAGALILLRRSGPAAFSDGEETFARLFATRAGAALSAASLYSEQARVTRTLMRDLLPPRLHQVHGVEFAGGYRAAEHRERVGGDFYDVHPGGAEDEESFVVLGDVCGKGLDAAVLTGKIRNTLHALLPLAGDHDRVLNLLNDALLSLQDTRFATLVLASAVRDGERVRLRLTSAGHPAPLLVRADGRVEPADTHGSLVGVLPAVRSVTAEVSLAPGETCLLYTDGITEARGGPFGDELFGEERLQEALTECGGMPAEAVVERVQMLAAQWTGGGRKDDMAVVAVTAPYPGGGPGERAGR